MCFFYLKPNRSPRKFEIEIQDLGYVEHLCRRAKIALV